MFTSKTAKATNRIGATTLWRVKSHKPQPVSRLYSDIKISTEPDILASHRSQHISIDYSKRTNSCKAPYVSKAVECSRLTYLHLKSNVAETWPSVSMNSAMVSSLRCLVLSKKRIAWLSDHFQILEDLEILLIMDDPSNVAFFSVYGWIYIGGRSPVLCATGLMFGPKAESIGVSQGHRLKKKKKKKKKKNVGTLHA
ncbi:unnamed protein product [Taenia asiatica]|uniref:DUF1758 domain-containing protein n=1 Tax=Taenia asiatica TaxID=60517 RepID=A0A0R3WER9_TAEAS|nr:unnamed protein product [Taenia asiatica]